MLDVAPTELLLVAFVALLVIGPKDLPKALRFVGHWVGKARGVARQFRSGFDTMVREAELADMEKKWAEENARIMREHPPTPPIDFGPPVPAATPREAVFGAGEDAPAETVAPPVVTPDAPTEGAASPAPAPAATPAADAR